jgi:hypothetical protein
MPRRNRPPQPISRPRRTGKTIHLGGTVHYLVTLSGPRYLTKNPHRAMKVTGARLALQGVTV